ncbi:MAG TPA: pilus assembly protein N-terminal domain-containing protein [Acidobacteriaceae bacterium]|nr:pilus assembly protein N-terminal domain-containing protein [Acidobacteriaceae bacterium]
MNVKSRISPLSLCAALFALAIPAFTGTQLRAQASSTVGQDSTRELSIQVGKTALIDFTRPVTRVSIGLGSVAEVNAVSPTEVLVNGQTPGSTTLIVWEQGGSRQFFNVQVHASTFVSNDEMANLRRQLSLQLPGQDIKVSGENGLIYLRGTVSDLNTSNRAVQIATAAAEAAGPAGAKGKVVNLLYVDIPATPPQILLKVRFMSVDRSLLKQLGLNIFSTGATNSIGTVATGQFSPPTVTVPSGGSSLTTTVGNALNLFIFRPDLNLGATIAALENQGLVESLAEPNLLAEDGKEASFLAGGEYPYPVVQGSSGTGVAPVTIEFKEYGIRLSFIPTIMPQGTIRLQLTPEVSALDFANAVEISGFNVPAIDIRTVNTEVELKNGQSFVIGGLLDNTESQTFEKIPFLGDIPILGKFFQSIQRQKNNTELIVLVTPVIVPPIPAGQSLPMLNFPQKFLPKNSNIPMHNPTAPLPTPPETTAIPVEQLVNSMKPEKPLQTSGSTTGMSAGASMGTP